MDPNAPAVIVAAEPEPAAEIFTIEIDPNLVLDDDTPDFLLELDHVAELLKSKSDGLKAFLLASKAKRARGRTAEAVLKCNPLPRVLSTRRVLTALAARAVDQDRPLLEVLLEMLDCLSFGKEALAQHFGKTEIERMCVNGDPKAPSMTIEPLGTGGEPDAAAAIRWLARLLDKKPKLFAMPPKTRPAKRDPKAPKVNYVIAGL